MSDISIVSLLANTQIQAAASPANNRNATGVPTSVLLGLVAGSFVTGIVVSRDGKSNTVLKTANGEITIKSDLPMKNGAEVVLRIESKGDNVTARIVTIDGRVPNAETAPVPEDTVDLAPPLLAGKANAPLPQPVADKTSDAAAVTPDKSSPAQTAKAPAAPAVIEPKPLWLTATLLTPNMDADVPSADTAAAPKAAAPKAGAVFDVRIVRIDPAVATATSTGASPVASNNAAQPQALAPAAALKLYAAYAPSSSSDTIKIMPASLPPSSVTPAPAEIGETAPVSVKHAFPASTLPPTMSETPKPSLAPIPSSVGSSIANVTATGISPLPATAAPALPDAAANAQPPALREPAGRAAVVSAANNPPQPISVNDDSVTFARFADGSMQAMVIAQGKAGESLVQTPLGLMKMHLPMPVPPGSPLVVEMKANPNGPAIPANPSLPATDALENIQLTVPAAGWPALEKTIDALAQLNPAIMAEALQRLPETGPKFASAILFFVAALRGGDVRNMLGPKAVALLEEKGRADLLGRLNGDVASLRGLLDAPANQWQTFAVPFLHQQELHQLHWHTRREAPETGQSDHGGMRFVVEVDTSHLGPLQFDGLVRKKEAALAFDMIIRSTAPLPLEMQQDIQAMFAQSAELTRYNGSVGFQVAREFPVQPMRERQAANAAGDLYA